jgi:diguanylate cyclase (GGDEF)-like protein
LVLLLALGLGFNTRRLVRIKRELQAERAVLCQQREALDRLAHYDPLTGVPNRRLLEDRLQVALARARRQDSRLAVCYLDLDNFKPINDLLGHAAGDRFLIEITRRLQQGLRAADTLARLGGDEFVLLLADLSHEDEWQPVLQRMLEALRQPVQIDGHAVASSASVGVVLFPAAPDDPADPDTLLRHADQAMYQAKQEGRDRYRVFDLKA